MAAQHLAASSRVIVVNVRIDPLERIKKTFDDRRAREREIHRSGSILRLLVRVLNRWTISKAVTRIRRAQQGDFHPSSRRREMEASFSRCPVDVKRDNAEKGSQPAVVPPRISSWNLARARYIRALSCSTSVPRVDLAKGVTLIPHKLDAFPAVSAPVWFAYAPSRRERNLRREYRPGRRRQNATAPSSVFGGLD